MSRMISSTGEMECSTDDLMENLQGSLQGDSKLACRYCARPFECQDDLTEHLKEHKTSYQCYVCSKTYSTPSKLQRHARVHSGERPYSCDTCGKKFRRSDHLKVHQKVHSPEKNYCRMCQQTYINEYQLTSHLKSLHNVKFINACTKCGEVFDDKEKLKVHMISHKDPTQNSANGIDTNDEKTMFKLVQDSLGPINPSSNYIIGLARFIPPSKSNLIDSDDGADDSESKSPAKKRKVSKNSSSQNEGSTMVDNDENMFILQSALQGMKGEPDQFEFEDLDGNDIEALGDKALLEEISEEIDPEKGAVPVHLEAGTHQIDKNHKVTEIVVFPKPGAKVTTYDKPITSMTAYENKIIKGPTAKPPPKVQYIQVDPKKMIGPASFKAKMKKKIESNYPVAQNQDSNSLQRLVYNVGLDPNVVGVGSTDKLQQEINARTVAKRKADADKVTGKGMFKCSHCCIYFEDQAMSLLHKSLHNADDADPFTCRKCLKKLGNRLEFTAHLVWHLEPGMEG